jgi:hypothetical protein
MRRQFRVPEKLTIRSDDSRLMECLGLLAAGNEALNLRGPVIRIDLRTIPDALSLDGVVRGEFATEAKGSRAITQLARVAARLEAAGAKALLLETEPDSEWVRQAELLRNKPRPDTGSRISLPIVLIPKQAPEYPSIELIVPAVQVMELPMRNVVGVLRGSDPALANQAIVFSAHLDHLGTNPKVGDGIYNGADDDASGVTAVLSLADAFAAMPVRPKRTLIFMTFWGEEAGLLGSKEFVARPSWPLAEIVANVNIEMIGRPEPGARNKSWMTGWTESDLGKLMNASSQRWGFEIFEHPKFSAMLYRSSDNWSFAEKGVVAHSFSAGSLHSDYHQPDDEWERLEIPHMTQVIRGLFLGAQSLANGEVTPTAN